MNLTDPLPMIVWSLSLLATGVLVIVEWRKRDGVRLRVGLWLSLHITISPSTKPP